MIAALLFICGNGNGVLMGPDAIMHAGAVTALVQDGTALQYNPAGLYATATRFDASANAFGLRLYSADRFISTAAGAAATGASTEILSIPSATTFARRVGDHVTLGAGLFAPRAYDYTLRARLRTDAGDTWTANLSETSTELRGSAGAAYHHALVSIGGALDVSYVGAFTASQAAVGVDSVMQGDHAVIAETASRKLIALALRLGVIARPHEHVRLGFSVASPAFSVLRIERVERVLGVAVASDRNFAIQPTDSVRGEFKISQPAVLRAGVAWFDERFTVGLDVMLAFGPGWATTIDAAVGAKARVTDTVWLGGGLFTDRNPTPISDIITALTVDYYGGTFAVEFLNRYQRADANAPIEFRTTVGLRYAYGSALVEATRVPESLAAGATETINAPARSHEIMLVIGSSLSL